MCIGVNRKLLRFLNNFLTFRTINHIAVTGFATGWSLSGFNNLGVRCKGKFFCLGKLLLAFSAVTAVTEPGPYAGRSISRNNHRVMSIRYNALCNNCCSANGTMASFGKSGSGACCLNSRIRDFRMRDTYRFLCNNCCSANRTMASFGKSRI